MSATVTTFPATGAFTVSPTSPFTEASGQALLAGLPYGADNLAVTARDGSGNPTTILFKRGSTVLKTRTITYSGGNLDTLSDA